MSVMYTNFFSVMNEYHLVRRNRKVFPHFYVGTGSFFIHSHNDINLEKQAQSVGSWLTTFMCSGSSDVPWRSYGNQYNICNCSFHYKQTHSRMQICTAISRRSNDFVHQMSVSVCCWCECGCQMPTKRIISVLWFKNFCANDFIITSSRGRVPGRHF